jgi:xanthine/CO dehydrogenase XdhC/CoxF family maturation factor
MWRSVVAAAPYGHVLSGRYDDGKLRRLHVPAGLNIGGKGPGEIAVSVLAEIIAHDHDRPGGPMRVGSR